MAWMKIGLVLVCIALLLMLCPMPGGAQSLPFGARVEIKTAGNTDGVDLDTRFHDIRPYPHPDRNPVRFVVTSSFPRFAYPVSGAESLGLKLYRADGITLIGEGNRAADGAFEVPFSRELTFSDRGRDQALPRRRGSRLRAHHGHGGRGTLPGQRLGGEPVGGEGAGKATAAGS